MRLSLDDILAFLLSFFLGSVLVLTLRRGNGAARVVGEALRQEGLGIVILAVLLVLVAAFGCPRAFPTRDILEGGRQLRDVAEGRLNGWPIRLAFLR
jgi:hypothetical protein